MLSKDRISHHLSQTGLAASRFLPCGRWHEMSYNIIVSYATKRFPLRESVAMSSGAAAAAAAAAELSKRREEEEMTSYSENDLSEGWEFKILRSYMKAFRKPEKLKKHLEEEGRAGWVLVEKFDDERLRLKRPASARRGDAALDFNPYRTQVGPSEGAVILVVLGIVFGVIVGVIGLVGLLMLAFKK